MEQIGIGGDENELYQYANVTPAIGTLITSGKATLHELDTVYGIEDMLDLIEIVYIDSHNKVRELNRVKRKSS